MLCLDANYKTYGVLFAAIWEAFMGKIFLDNAHAMVVLQVDFL